MMGKNNPIQDLLVTLSVSLTRTRRIAESAVQSTPLAMLSLLPDHLSLFGNLRIRHLRHSMLRIHSVLGRTNVLEAEKVLASVSVPILKISSCREKHARRYSIDMLNIL